MLLGGACVVCGNIDIRVLQINHKNEKDRRGYSLVMAILAGRRGKDDLDLRCANCNLIYEYEKGRRVVAAPLKTLRRNKANLSRGGNPTWSKERVA